MRVSRLVINNFRGIHSATVLLPKTAVLIGDNNAGKTTILEALDLVLGPDRLNRFPVINEHDFFRGIYLTGSQKENRINENGRAAVQTNAESPVKEVSGGQIQDDPGHEPIASGDSATGSNGPVLTTISIEATITDLSDEQKGRFGDYIEFWDENTNSIYDSPPISGVDMSSMSEALRVTFIGQYNVAEDDFDGATYFARSLIDGDEPVHFRKGDKQFCGFLYLRSLRTGSRALSLERGSLLDIILRLKEIRPQMWEETIRALRDHCVASDPKIGVSGVLESISKSLKKYVPKEWGYAPHLKVSHLTRDHLRSVITAFITTEDSHESLPYFRQGTGTINMLVLALLSQIRI